MKPDAEWVRLEESWTAATETPWRIEAIADAPLAAWVCDTCRRSVPAGPITTRQDDLAHGSGPCYVCDEPTRWSR